MQFQVVFHFVFFKVSFLIFLAIRTKKFLETIRSVSLVKVDKNDDKKVWKRLGILNIYILLYVLKCVKIC